AAQGRKGTAINAVRGLFREADPRWESTRVKGGLKSPEAMTREVDDYLADDTRLMLIEPEFARLTGRMARTDFSPKLRLAGDGEPLEDEVKDSRRSLRATHTHISLVGLITPQELERHHKRLSQAGGLESRLLFCWSAPDSDTSPFAKADEHFGDL